MRLRKGEVVQFGSAHKWAGVLGIIKKVKNAGDKTRYMVAVPMPTGENEDHGTAYIFAYDDDLLRVRSNFDSEWSVPETWLIGKYNELYRVKPVSTTQGGA